MTPPDTHSQTSSNEGRIVLPAGIALLFLCVMLVQATVKPMWLDELLTFWIGQQKSFGGIWRALGAGADPNPPLTHVLSWWATGLLGTSEVAVRLPSIVAMGLGMVCLWLFLRRRTAPVYAAAGCLAVLAMPGSDYGYDARSYSLLMFFTMAALLCWSRSVDAKGLKRSGLLLGMALALAAGLSSNYYGALAFLPVAAGEAVFSLKIRRLRPGPWVAMVVAALSLLAYRQLIRMNIVEFGPHAWNKPQLSMLSDSYFWQVGWILWPIVGLLIYGLWNSRVREGQVTASLFPAWERAAIGVLIVYPVLALLVALGSPGMVSLRCAVPVCFGVAIGGAGLLARSVNKRGAAIVVALLFLWVPIREAGHGRFMLRQRRAFMVLEHAVERTAAPGEPVVVGEQHVLMTLYWYASPELRQQIVMPIDFDAIHRTLDTDSAAQNLWGGRDGVFPMPIDTPGALLRERGERVLVGPLKGWVAAAMEADGYELREVPTNVQWKLLAGPLSTDAIRVVLVSPRPSQQ